MCSSYVHHLHVHALLTPRLAAKTTSIMLVIMEKADTDGGATDGAMKKRLDECLEEFAACVQEQADLQEKFTSASQHLLP